MNENVVFVWSPMPSIVVLELFCLSTSGSWLSWIVFIKSSASRPLFHCNLHCLQWHGDCFCQLQVDSQSSILASSANCRIWLPNLLSISRALFSLQDSIVVVRILLIVVSLESHIKYVSSATALLFLRQNARLWANTWILNQKISCKCFVIQSTTVAKVLFV
jgi:hypothetical protein